MLILSADDEFNIGTRQFFGVHFLFIFNYQIARKLRPFESVFAFSSFLTGRERSTSDGAKEGVTRVGLGGVAYVCKRSTPPSAFPP